MPKTLRIKLSLWWAEHGAAAYREVIAGSLGAMTIIGLYIACRAWIEASGPDARLQFSAVLLGIPLTIVATLIVQKIVRLAEDRASFYRLREALLGLDRAVQAVLDSDAETLERQIERCAMMKKLVDVAEREARSMPLSTMATLLQFHSVWKIDYMTMRHNARYEAENNRAYSAIVYEPAAAVRDAISVVINSYD